MKITKSVGMMGSECLIRSHGTNRTAITKDFCELIMTT
jgi:hypothetical protein